MSHAPTQPSSFQGHTQQMMEMHPHPASVDSAALLACIQACFDCAQACGACADACLGENDPKPLTRCIRLNLDCADVCDTTGKILSRQTAFEPALAKAVLEACALASKLCGDECDRHGHHMEHCRVCADACRRCEDSCRRLMAKTASA